MVGLTDDEWDMLWLEGFIISAVVSSVFGTWLFIDAPFSGLYSKSKKHDEDTEIARKVINYLHRNSNEKIAIYNIFHNIYTGTHFLYIFIFLLCSYRYFLPSTSFAVFWFFIFSISYMLPSFYIHMKFQPRGDIRKYLKVLIINFIDLWSKLLIMFFIFVLIYIITTTIGILNFVSLILNFETVSGENLSNQLTLAGICFTFAVGGTVIVSLRNIYKKQIENLQGKKIEFEKWFEKNEEKIVPNQSLFSISISDFNNFNEAVEELRNKMVIKERDAAITFISKFKFFKGVTIVFCFIGLWCLCPFTNPNLDMMLGIIFSLSILYFVSLANIIQEYLDDT